MCPVCVRSWWMFSGKKNIKNEIGNTFIYLNNDRLRGIQYFMFRIATIFFIFRRYRIDRNIYTGRFTNRRTIRGQIP